jgi:hypothetical protein
MLYGLPKYRPIRERIAAGEYRAQGTGEVYREEEDRLLNQFRDDLFRDFDVQTTWQTMDVFICAVGDAYRSGEAAARTSRRATLINDWPNAFLTRVVDAFERRLRNLF